MKILKVEVNRGDKLELKDEISKAMIVRLIHEAHDTCFLTNSIETEIIIEPNFIFKIV